MQKYLTKLVVILILAVFSLGQWPTLVQAQESRPLPKGHVWFQTDFEAAQPKWPGPAQLESGYQSSQSLAVEQKPGQTQRSSIIPIVLPVESMRGYTIRATAMIKAANVSAKPNAWNGIKFMIAIESPTRKTWPQASLRTGSFEWQRAVFTTRIPVDATRVTLILGLEEVTGKTWFDDIKVAVVKPPPVAISAAPQSGPMFKGHDLPRLRGAMISPNLKAEDLRVLGQTWNANLIRWQLIRHARPNQPFSLTDYDQWLETELKKLDAMLPFCEQYGLLVVVDLHSPPGGKATSGGYAGSDDRLFSDKSCQDKLIEVWRKIATRYRDAKTIWAYDLANEPVEEMLEEGCDDWHDLAERTAQAIRLIDPQRAIIVEPPNWGGPDALSDFLPLNVSNVVYSVHMYLPHAFTHQGVYQSGPPLRYPGIIDGKMWDKSQLEAALKPVIDFQKKYGVHIYIGEFSAIRWAPDQSAGRYLNDVIEIFEHQGWDWSYHAFREWSGWSVEHGSDRQTTTPAITPTDRQRLLCDWFAKNRKPNWQTGSPKSK